MEMYPQTYENNLDAVLILASVWQPYEASNSWRHLIYQLRSKWRHTGQMHIIFDVFTDIH